MVNSFVSLPEVIVGTLVNKLNFIAITMVFFLGWCASAIYSGYSDSDYIQSESSNTIADQKINSNGLYGVAMEEFEAVQNLFESNSSDRNKNSPSDWISMDQIHVYNNRVIIDISNPEWALFTDTKSMDPVIDSGSNAIEIIPKTEKDLRIGDIVAYESKYAEGTITHRIVEISSDDSGWFARMKGDNNERVDPGKVRFEQIKRVVVAVIY